MVKNDYNTMVNATNLSISMYWKKTILENDIICVSVFKNKRQKQNQSTSYGEIR